MPPAPSSIVIGADSSTQSTKAAFVDAANGQPARRAPGPAPGHRRGGARESDPEEWWRALREAVGAGLRECGVPASAVTGIAVAGQQHGLVVLDSEGRPLRPAANAPRTSPESPAY